MTITLSLTLQEKKIKNYLRKQISHNNNNNIRSKLMCMYYENINNIPIQKELNNNDDYIKKEFPYYFNGIDKNKIIDIFNLLVSQRKPLIIPLNQNKNNNQNNYDISEDDNNCLEISVHTFRPYYYNDWKQKTEDLNKISYDNQTSFYNEYLRFFMKYKKFPDFNEFIVFMFNKNEMPLHKDIRNAFMNIQKSYEPIKEYIKEHNMTYTEIREIILLSTSISNRKLMQTV